MIVICSLCDKKTEIEDHSLLAKKFRNHPIHLYTCQACYDRIKEKRLAREKNKNS